MIYGERVKMFIGLGKKIEELLEDKAAATETERFEIVLKNAHAANQWFTRENLLTAFKGISRLLEKESFTAWAESYSDKLHDAKKNIGVIMAGNIPIAGFHDMLCVLLSGNKLVAKLSSEDKFLIPFIADLLAQINPAVSGNITFSDKLNSVDAAIATGNNNSARYFEYYFSKVPHIIRKNRNGVAVLTGNETWEELSELGKDIFLYFGLGCRNVSKLYVPEGYDFGIFFEAMHGYINVMRHNKYMNNYDYHRAVFLMNEEKFLTNNFMIIKNSSALSTPVSVLHYEFYSESDLILELEKHKDDIQCVVSKEGAISNAIRFGQAQFPAAGDFADGVDTMKFLTEYN